MNKRTLLLTLCALAVAVGIAAALLFDTQPARSTAQTLDLGSVLGENADTQGFARADHVRRFQFPRDYGAHPRFRNEWWYFTGNLRTADGRRFGYELALFRIALTPAAPNRASAWATNQIYMGHFALTDVRAGKFHYFERFARGAVGLAGAQAQPFHVWLENWKVAASDHGGLPWTLRAEAKDVSIRLQLTPTKPVILQGDRGLSRKSATPGNASYYYSLPRLDSVGQISVGGQRFDVNGISWMDREWSTSALASDQAGWDWFSLHLSNGDDLMFYQLRRKDGSIDPFSNGTWIARDGQAKHLARSDVDVQVLDWWTSPRGGRYPGRWRLRIPRHGLELEVYPLLADQELNVSVRYWEGAVAVRGEQAGEPVTGNGYVELTGYAEDREKSKGQR